MCWFITIGVPARIAQTIGTHAHGIDLAPFGGSPTAALFPAGLSCVVATRGGCSCDLMEFPASRSTLDEVKERARLARRGWPSAKIERAIASKRDSLSRPQEPQSDSGAVALRELVADLVRASGSVHLFTTMYSGNIHTEAVEVCGTAALTLAAFEQSMLEPSTLTVVRGNTS
jgi:hypothetical protein